MTESRSIEDIVSEAKQRLFLHAYDIVIEHVPHPDPDSDGADAECVTNHPYLNARLRLFPAFHARTPDRQRHIVYHELAHIITRETKAMMRRLSTEKLVAWQDVLDADEYLTDLIARIAQGERP